MYRLLSGVYHRRWYKVCYFARHAHLGILPFKYLAKSLDDVLAEYVKQPKEIQQSIMQRVNYYNKLNRSIALSGSLNKVGYFKKHGSSQYFFDLANLLRYFPKGTSFAHQFGDVTHIPEQPTLVKSRPIFVGEENANSVILKLDSVRHFYIYPDPFNFSQKLDKLIWRGGGHQPHRLAFLQKFYSHPSCDIACVHRKSQGKPWHGSFMSIQNQLRYKFILSIEGNDVATNLKWIMASKSLCFMTTPKYETWLMEGLLQPNVHYVHLQDDYSDLDEKLTFYRKNPDAAEKIIMNANKWMQPFFDKKQELITSLLVLKKYFEKCEKTY
ncbi:glycosyl transferase family 90 [Histophilus somni]|uniref:glycosyl transferase family 90 n=1 Tax=Histophilus somni TaxID=731 RepID=UPI00201ED727|nr:glycosyl transferase family 90 [Histophilus somni]